MSNSTNETSVSESVPPKRSRKEVSYYSNYEEEDSDHVIPYCKDNQASIPKLIPPSKRSIDLDNDKSVLVWSPNTNLNDQEIDHFVAMAKDKYGYTSEQALGVLFNYNYDIKKAEAMLSCYKPCQDEWTQEDKIMFEKAVRVLGKSFRSIQNVLPNKSMASIVRYYYLWKNSKVGTRSVGSAGQTSIAYKR